MEGFSTYQQDAELHTEDSYYGVPSSAVEKPRAMAELSTHKHNIALTFLYKF